MNLQVTDAEIIAAWAERERLPDTSVGLAGSKAWEVERKREQDSFYVAEAKAVRDAITSTGAEVRHVGYFGHRAKSRFAHACWSIQLQSKAMVPFMRGYCCYSGITHLDRMPPV